jgi:hypothetical protein
VVPKRPPQNESSMWFPSSTKALRLRPRSTALGGASSAAERLVSFLGKGLIQRKS